MVKKISRQPSTLQVMRNKTQLKIVQYFKYLGSVITNYARSTRQIKSMFITVNATLNKETVFASKLNLQFNKETSKMLHLEK